MNLRKESCGLSFAVPAEALNERLSKPGLAKAGCLLFAVPAEALNERLGKPGLPKAGRLSFTCQPKP
jgi:hypothetical protein